MPVSKHQDSINIRSYEAGPDGAVTLPHIANYFQESAGRHAHQLDLDISDLQEKGATWVLYRMHIKVDQFPRRWEDVTVNTWPSSGDGVRAFRDYELTNKSGQQLAVGVSQWMILNTSTRRPMRMPRHIVELNLGVTSHLLPADKQPFPDIDTVDHELSVPVGLYDIDMNHHVNNVRYIEWMTGYLPDSLIKKAKCREISIQFHKEAVAGWPIRVITKDLGNRSLLHNILNTDGELLAEGLSRWR
ncbi:MAG: hypothetical protein GVY08_07600 [Bacteroidetes bacterium]|jgi:acyl-ACP thioesterase|nr:hypothetical protein [Bacteroidota bacterium]